MEFKTKKAEDLYRHIKKKDNEEDKKREIIKYLCDYK